MIRLICATNPCPNGHRRRYVVRVGWRYLCSAEDGHVYLGDLDNAGLWSYDSVEGAGEAGVKATGSVVKFAVEEVYLKNED
jgi:hypothetical protein